MTAPIEIGQATEEDAAAWDAYVKTAPGASFFHRWGWRRVVAAAYGYQTIGFIARRGGDIVGLLPLVDVRSELLGRSLVSTAFTVGGGLVGDDAEVRRAIAEAASEEGAARGVRYIELRAPADELEGWQAKNDVYAGFEKRLPADEDENLRIIPRRRRASVRKGMKAAEAGELSATFDGRVDDFYDLYAHAMRDLGTPIFPRRFVRALTGEFGDEMDILIVRAYGEPVLALLTFYFRDRVMPYYFGARRDAREHGAYDYAIWLQMRRGAAKNALMFDFGRSKYGSGSFEYKSFWGFEPHPLEYRYRLIRARETPNVNPNNPKFAGFSKAWRRLPLPVANIAGPLLARHLA